MIVLRKTMDAAVAKERDRFDDLACRFGQALHASAALQRQMADWITEKGETQTPEQAAALFYSHDSKWQAQFFNVMQDVVQAVHDAMPPKRPGEFRLGPGYPAGEGQWCWMADDLDDKGFETIDAMHWHAKNRREPASAMSAGTAETQSGSGLQPASAGPQDDAQRPPQ